jgi:pimeloyl-ACP methyl ester carboxylesterase
LIPTNGHQIVEDVKALHTYLGSSDYQATLPEGVVPDLKKIVVSGFSGGGYVARLLAIEMTERQAKGEAKGVECKGLVSYFGMGGDVFLDDWAKLDQPGSTSSWEPVKSLYESKEISDAPYTPGLKGWENKPPRDVVWDWHRANGLFVDVLAGTKGEIRDAWAKEQAGEDEEKERVIERIVSREHHKVIPQLWFGDKENAEKFPPSLFIHGTKDDKVPYEETTRTVDQLKRAGNGKVELVSVPGVDHNLTLPGTEDAPPETAEAHAKVVDFVVRQLQ